MIKRFGYLLLLLFTAVSCRDISDHPEYDFDDAVYINFASPEITLETRADEASLPEGVRKGSTLLSSISPNSSFGVIGYCRAKVPGSQEIDNNSGTSPWSAKSQNVFPEIFLNQEVTYDGSVCRYQYSGTGEPRKWLSESETGTDVSGFKYTFFSYYPKDKFTVEKPQSLSDKGAPVIKYSMPFTSKDTSTVLTQSDIPDVMLDAKYNLMSYDGKISFNYSHVLTALSFTVNNYSGILGDGGVVKGKELIVKNIRLKGEFWKSVRVDFSSSVVGLEFTDTYKGTYIIYDNPSGMTIPYDDVNFKPAFADQYILLVSGKHVEGEGGMSYLGNIEVVIDYVFGGETKTYRAGRPGTFVPVPGTMYQAQLNFVGDAFVLQFVNANGEAWEEGSDSDITFE